MSDDTFNEMSDEIVRLRAENERLKGDWPERNQVEGLGRAAGLLYELRYTLNLTSAGRDPRFRIGAEPHYGQILHHLLEQIEIMVVPDHENARRRYADSQKGDGA